MEWQRLDQMMEFLRSSRNDGTLPLVSDDDGGRALGIVSSYRSCRFDEESLASRRRLPSNGRGPDTRHHPPRVMPFSGPDRFRSTESSSTVVVSECSGGHALQALVLVRISVPLKHGPRNLRLQRSPEWRDSSAPRALPSWWMTDQSTPDGTFKWKKRHSAGSCNIFLMKASTT
jgi:hypothetical protein